jgi:cytochrome P450
MAAGSDTTAIASSAIIELLIKQPENEQKLHEEIKECTPVTFQEGQKMPYLVAVIKEAFRLHPGTGQLTSRTVHQGGALLSGHFFPTGVSLSCL